LSATSNGGRRDGNAARAGLATAADRGQEAIVQLIIYYLVLMIAGDFAAYLIGLVVEREFGSNVSLIVFLVLYFLFLWVAWLIAVRLTEPRREGVV
jgi:cation transporter-like permease